MPTGRVRRIKASITIKEGPGLQQQWRGRFWLPESDRVEPRPICRLIGGDEGPGNWRSMV